METALAVHHILILIHTLGLMAVAVFFYGRVQHWIRHRLLRRTVTGIVFGIATVIVMLQPIDLGAGFQADARGAFVGIASVFAGWPGALAVMVITAVARMIIGGNGALTGALVIIVTGISAVSVGALAPPGRRLDRLRWLLIGAACVVPTTLALMIFTAASLPTTIFVTALTALTAMVFSKMLETEQRRGRRERALAQHAATDPLTDLPNRRSFEDYTRQLEAAKVRDVILLLLDIDHFKQINDRYGHDVGDTTLRAIGAAIRSCMRPTDFAARVGGEEFAVVIRTTSPADGRRIAERFREELRIPIAAFSGPRSSGGASSGGGSSGGAGPGAPLAGAAPTAGPAAGDQRTTVSIGGFDLVGQPYDHRLAYRGADEALYRSKHYGRDRVTVTRGAATPLMSVG